MASPTNSAAEQARALLERDIDARVEAVRVLANAADQSAADDERAATSAAEHATTWATAIAAGWSEKELRATGVRPSKAGTTTRRPAAQNARSKARKTHTSSAQHGNPDNTANETIATTQSHTTNQSPTND